AKDSAAELALRLNQGDAGWDSFLRRWQHLNRLLQPKGKAVLPRSRISL
ncbi:hypothetical protein AAULR_11450, partial [Lacticaseibacillus rhamnosus MTCC 5462]